MQQEFIIGLTFLVITIIMISIGFKYIPQIDDNMTQLMMILAITIFMGTVGIMGVIHIIMVINFLRG